MGGAGEWGGLVVGRDTLVLPGNNSGTAGKDRWDEGAEWGGAGE